MRENRSASVSVTELSKHLNIKYQAAWAELRKLRESGLVQSRDCPDDERYAEYFLTERKSELGG